MHCADKPGHLPGLCVVRSRYGGLVSCPVVFWGQVSSGGDNIAVDCPQAGVV